ncbi:MAG TPA: hypothetical protein VLW50_08920 [Streptosporangiaceae bacterium]|nr:hypothetical protein [Streptosporangiaceae bacterium]
MATQTPEAIREANPGELSRFLIENGAPSRKVAEIAASAMAAAAAQTVQLPGEASAAVLVAGMARQLPARAGDGWPGIMQAGPWCGRPDPALAWWDDRIWAIGPLCR